MNTTSRLCVGFTCIRVSCHLQPRPQLIRDIQSRAVGRLSYHSPVRGTRQRLPYHDKTPIFLSNTVLTNASQRPFKQYHQQQHRFLSTNNTGPSPQREFLILVPDFPGTSTQRAHAQQEHAQQVQPLVDSGHLTLGSVILQKHPEEEGEKPVVTGSVILVHAESESEVRTWLREDAYATEGVWDVEKAQVWAVKTGIRKGL